MREQNSKSVNCNKAELSELINKVKTGDKNAFQQLYLMTWKPIYYTILKTIGDETDSLQILNDVYVDVYANIKKLKNEGLFIKWINQITYAKRMDFLRNKYKINSKEITCWSVHTGTVTDDSSLPENALINKESHRQVLKAVEDLPFTQRDAIFMFYYNSLTINEIAEITKCTANTVYKRLHDAKKSLKAKLESVNIQSTAISSATALTILGEVFQHDIDAHAAPVYEAVSSTAIIPLLLSSTAQASVAPTLIAGSNVFIIKSAIIGAGILTAALTIPSILQGPQAEKPLTYIEHEIAEQQLTTGKHTTEALTEQLTIEQQSTTQQVASIPNTKGSGIPSENTPASYLIADFTETSVALAYTRLPQESKAYDDEKVTDTQSEQLTATQEDITTSRETTTASHTEAAPSSKENNTSKETSTSKESSTSKKNSTSEKNNPSKAETDITKSLSYTYELSLAPKQEKLINEITILSGSLINPKRDTIQIHANTYKEGIPGTYEVSLSAKRKDDGTNVIINAEIKVVDTEPPAITLAHSRLTVSKDTALTPTYIVREAGISATDNGDLAVSLTIIGLDDIDTSKKGNHTLTIVATDFAGNESSKKLIITIK